METITSDQELTQTGFYWRVKDGVKALICRPLEEDGFVNGFSTRLGGVSPMPRSDLSLAGFNDDTAANILENRRRFLKLFPGKWSLAGCWQIHGDEVRVVANLNEAKPAENELGDTIFCDAVVSAAAGVLASIKTADCVPVLIGDPKRRAFAAIHAGWRGTVAGVVSQAIETLKSKYHSSPDEMCVGIGPAAGACCYEVGQDVIDAYTNRFDYATSLFAPTREGHATIDLLKANREQLISSGVLSNRIYTSPFCTMCRTDLFFSYRREKQAQGRVGRLMAVIGRL
jgi:purine-nucleoside/S-methyl-5'-thioadenosine phosphorylase / adenosine deaminase